MSLFKQYVVDPMEAPEYEGLPMGFPRLEQVIGGIRQESIILVGSTSGVGKTAFVDMAYVLEPYDYFIKNKDKMNIDFHCIYRSMERSKKFKMQKWTCYRLFKDYHIVCDVATLNKWKNKLYILPDYVRELIKSYEGYFEEMWEYVTVIDGRINPTGIFEQVKDYASTIGTETEVEKIDKKGFKYTERNYVRDQDKEDTIVNIVIDNLDTLNTEKSRVDGNKRMSEKEVKDKMMEYCTMFRDLYRFTPIPVSQFNRSLGNINRFRAKTVEPEPDDFKGTGNSYNDADIVLAPFNPKKLQVKDYLGYDVDKFTSMNRGNNRFRGLVVLKNSYGPDDVSIGLNFLGECGHFREIPREVSEEDYYIYANYMSKKKITWRYPGLEYFEKKNNILNE